MTAEIAVMNRNGVGDVAIEEVGGMLSDHYDPRAKVVRLSSHNYAESSLAAIAVGAHEVGHVLQHARGYVPLALRSAIEFPFPSVSCHFTAMVPPALNQPEKVSGAPRRERKPTKL